MNASPANLNPVAPAQTQPASAKQQDAAAQDKPFSQVLSSEMAQNRRNQEASGQPGTQSADEAESKPVETVDESQNAAAPISNGEETAADPLQADMSAATFAAHIIDAKDALREPPQADIPDTPAINPALVIPPGHVPPGAAGVEGAQPRQTEAPSARLTPTLMEKKGRQPQAPQLKPAANETAAAQKSDPAASGKTAAAGFAEQLAATRQADAGKPAESLPDFLGNPAMRVTAQAMLDTPTATHGVTSNKLAPSVGTTAWGQALGEKIVWMAAGAQQTASLTLNPPNLGPLQVVLNISNDQATANFFSAQPEVRHALEAAFPRLKEMMNEAGIQLGQATVSADTPQQQAFEQPSQRVTPVFPGTSDAPSAELQTLQPPVRQSGRGLVDTFA